MNLLEFFNKETTAPKQDIVITAVISGIANGIFLALINQSAEMAAHQEVTLYYFTLFGICFLLFMVTRRYYMSTIFTALQDAIRQVRIRITDKLRHAELRHVENLDKAHVYTQLTQDTNQIAYDALMLVNASQGAIILAVGLLYIAVLSPPGFIVALIAIGIAADLYISRTKRLAGQIEQLTQKRTEFFTGLTHVLDGFKEIKLNHSKSDDLFASMEQIALEARNVGVSAGLEGINILMFTPTFAYLLLGTIIFILPLLSATHTAVVIKLTTAALFILTPLETLLNAATNYTRANIAIANLVRLEAQLDEAARRDASRAPERPLRPLRTFKTIQLSQVVFRYTDARGFESFALGPIDLKVQQGEMLFIIGGNGSGKSTLLKLLTGLYYPDAGTLWVDDERLLRPQYPAYRELFAVIFADFHLFDRLYGLDSVDEAQVNRLLRDMELDTKTAFVDGKFTQLNLSTGQRKRLAFIAALLENRPIYVFDELAADQDPTFRRYFYEVVLHDLQQQGKTIIAVTHDDRFFGIADRLVKMEYGTVLEETRPR